jgi:flagellar hook assembly protein FlgD
VLIKKHKKQVKMNTKQSIATIIAYVALSANAQLSLDSELNLNKLIKEYSLNISSDKDVFEVHSDFDSIDFKLSVGSDNWSKVEIFNAQGEYVLKIEIEGSANSINEFKWNGLNAKGEKLAKGKYYAVYSAKGNTSKKQVVYIR